MLWCRLRKVNMPTNSFRLCCTISKGRTLTYSAQRGRRSPKCASTKSVLMLFDAHTCTASLVENKFTRAASWAHLWNKSQSSSIAKLKIADSLWQPFSRFNNNWFRLSGKAESSLFKSTSQEIFRKKADTWSIKYIGRKVTTFSVAKMH